MSEGMHDASSAAVSKVSTKPAAPEPKLGPVWRLRIAIGDLRRGMRAGDTKLLPLLMKQVMDALKVAETASGPQVLELQMSATALLFEASGRKLQSGLVADPKGFEKLAGKKMNKANAPRVIQLPPAVAQGAQSSWDRSFPDGKAKEQGGNIVRNADRSYGWRAGGRSKNDTFVSDPDDIGRGQRLVGAGHTHPYESGATDVSFSGEDISSLVTGDERLEVLQSGRTVFVVARTAEFDALVEAAFDEDPIHGEQKLQARIETSYDRVRKQTAKRSLQEQAELATTQVCREFKLVYYRGEGSKLARVE
jgi:hypothetical protein